MSQSMRITDHPILGADEPKKKVTIYYEGTPIEANEGEPIAIALANAGIRTCDVTAVCHREDEQAQRHFLRPGTLRFLPHDRRRSSRCENLLDSR